MTSIRHFIDLVESAGRESSVDTAGSVKSVPLLTGKNWKGENVGYLPVEVVVDRARAGQINVLFNGHVRFYARFGEPTLDQNIRNDIRDRLYQKFEPASEDGIFWRMTNNRHEPELAKKGLLRVSHNHADETDELGLSVANGVHYLGSGYKYGYQVRGTPVGTGSDGEPLLDPRCIEVIGKLTLAGDIDREERRLRSAHLERSLAGMGWSKEQYAAALNHLVGMTSEQFVQHAAGHDQGDGGRP
jgi:hypothetical protein